MPETCGATNPETGSTCRLPPDLHASHVAGFGPTFEHWSRPSSQIDPPKSEPGRLVEVARRITGRDQQEDKTGQQLGAEAMDRAEGAAPQWWKDEARETVLRVARAQPEFTVDDVWEAGLTDLVEHRQGLGGVFRSIAAQGLIENTGEKIVTTSSKRHGVPITVWRSKIVGETPPPPGLLAL